MFGHEPAEGSLGHLNNCNRYYGDNNGKIIQAKLHKLWKHNAGYLGTYITERITLKCFKPRNNSKCEIGQAVMATNNVCHGI